MQKLFECDVSLCSAFMIEDHAHRAILLTEIVLKTKFRWRHHGMLVLHTLFILS